MNAKSDECENISHHCSHICPSANACRSGASGAINISNYVNASAPLVGYSGC